MRIQKHYGRLVGGTQDPVVVIFMELEGDIDNCLYVNWTQINPVFRTEIAQLATSTAGQAAIDLGPILATAQLASNVNILQSLHDLGLIHKTAHTNIEMQSSYDAYMNLATIIEAMRKLRTEQPVQLETQTSEVMTITTEAATKMREPVVQTPVSDLENKVSVMADQMAQMQAMMAQLIATMSPKTVE
jgi:hypothetical protein